MSYDLMVFEPGAVPQSHAAFMEWYFRQTKWKEGHSYGDPAVTSARLRAWFEEMRALFPALNGVFAQDDPPEDEASAVEYSIGKQFIYVSFTWSKADVAYRTVLSLAEKHRIGFFDVSSDEAEVWLPDGEHLSLAHKKEPPTLLNRIRRIFHLKLE